MRVPEIETARLRLRSYRESDIPELVPLIGTRDVAATTLRIPHPYTEKDAREFVAGMQAEDSDPLFAILIRESNRLCGGIGLRM
jgi:ribosomal-protein-alanine N-acetyltransferase